MAGTTTTTITANHDDADEKREEVQVRRPSQEPAMAALLERARAMAAQAVAEIFQDLRLEDGVVGVDEVGCMWRVWGWSLGFGTGRMNSL